MVMCRQGFSGLHSVSSRLAFASWRAILQQPACIPEPASREEVRKGRSSDMPCAFHLSGRDVARPGSRYALVERSLVAKHLQESSGNPPRELEQPHIPLVQRVM